MKYINRFDMNEDKPSNGDYVICGGKSFGILDDKEFVQFVISNIGKITNYSNFYTIKYDLTGTNIYKSGNYFCALNDILYWSKNKEELELKLKTNKFNI